MECHAWMQKSMTFPLLGLEASEGGGSDSCAEACEIRDTYLRRGVWEEHSRMRAGPEGDEEGRMGHL